MYTIGPRKPTFLEILMVNNLLFRWPKPLFFMVLGLMIYIYILDVILPGTNSNFIPENQWLGGR